MNKLYIAWLDKPFSREIFERLSAYVSPKRRERLGRLSREEDKKQSLYAALLLRIALCKALSLPNSALSFETDTNGKPYMSGQPSLPFSLSHTDKAVAVALSDEAVGVDIEKLRQANGQIARRFFTAREAAYVLSKDSDRRFFEIWTKKEAYIKRSGAGLSCPLRSFDVLKDNAEEIHTWERNGYMLSVCTAVRNIQGFCEPIILSEQALEEQAHQWLR